MGVQKIATSTSLPHRGSAELTGGVTLVPERARNRIRESAAVYQPYNTNNFESIQDKRKTCIAIHVFRLS